MSALVAALDRLGWTYKQGEKYILTSCPLAPWTHPKKVDTNPSLIMWERYNRWKCYSCGHTGEISDLFRKYNEFSGNNIDHEEFDLFISAPEMESMPNAVLFEAILDNFEPGSHNDCVAYLLKRGIDLDSIDRYNLKYDTNNRNVVVPVYDGRDKGLVGAYGRRASMVEKRHHNYFGFQTQLELGGFQHLEQDRNLVVEGLFDVLKCWKWAEEIGFNVYSTFTASLSQSQANKLLDTSVPNHIAWDQDSAGKRARSKLRLLNEDYGLTVYDWAPETLDVGDMDYRTFMSIFN